MNFKLFFSLQVVILFIGCTGYAPNTLQQASVSSLNDRQIREREAERQDNLRDAKRGDACEDASSGDECHSLCRSIYSRSDDREECEELDRDKVDDIYEVYSALDSTRDLTDINAESFELYLDVSITGFTRLIRDYKPTDAEDVLKWISEDDNIAELIRDEDDEFRILNDLLMNATRTRSFQRISVPFTTEFDRYTLFEYTISSGNRSAMDYFFEYIFQIDPNCRSNRADNGRNVQCLTSVCEIVRGVDNERDRQYLLGQSTELNDFIRDIIRGQSVNTRTNSNADGWVRGSSTGQINSVSDLDETWADEDGSVSNTRTICGGLSS